MTWQEMRLDIMAALAPKPDPKLIRQIGEKRGLSDLQAEAQYRYDWAAALVAERERRKMTTDETHDQAR